MSNYRTRAERERQEQRNQIVKAVAFILIIAVVVFFAAMYLRACKIVL